MWEFPEVRKLLTFNDFSFLSVGPSLVSRSDGRSVGRMVGQLVGWSVSCSDGRSVESMVGQLVRWSVNWSDGRLIGQMVGRSFSNIFVFDVFPLIFRQTAFCLALGSMQEFVNCCLVVLNLTFLQLMSEN